MWKITLLLILGQSSNDQSELIIDIKPPVPTGVEITLLDAYDYAPYIEITSPLYRAIYHTEKGHPVWVRYTVSRQPEQVSIRDDDPTWTPTQLKEFQIGPSYLDEVYEYYLLIPPKMVEASPNWQDGNITPLLIPSLNTNREILDQLENEITVTAIEKGWCQVTITLSSDENSQYGVPNTVIYNLQYPGGERTEILANQEIP